jgi:hypothetical protein
MSLLRIGLKKDLSTLPEATTTEKSLKTSKNYELNTES